MPGKPVGQFSRRAGMKQPQSREISGRSAADSAHRTLWKLASGAAGALLIYSLVTMVLLITIGGPPETVDETLTLLQNNRLQGLLRLDVLTTLFMPLYYLLFWGLYAALNKTHGVYAALATVFLFAGLTLFLATPSAFSWLSLSDKFAAAASEAQKTRLRAAGEAIMASDMWHGSGARVGGILLQLGAAGISLVMLRSRHFSRSTAYVGIVTHTLDLARGVIGLFSSTGLMILMTLAGPLYLVWFPLLARDFWRLRHDEPALDAPRRNNDSA
jgi:hypothetical protein